MFWPQNRLKIQLLELQLRVLQLEQERDRRAADWELQQHEIGRLLASLRTERKRQKQHQEGQQGHQGPTLADFKAGRR